MIPCVFFSGDLHTYLPPSLAPPQSPPPRTCTVLPEDASTSLHVTCPHAILSEPVGLALKWALVYVVTSMLCKLPGD